MVCWLVGCGRGVLVFSGSFYDFLWFVVLANRFTSYVSYLGRGLISAEHTLLALKASHIMTMVLEALPVILIGMPGVDAEAFRAVMSLRAIILVAFVSQQRGAALVLEELIPRYQEAFAAAFPQAPVVPNDHHLAFHLVDAIRFT